MTQYEKYPCPPIWMNKPATRSRSCPPGLEYLTPLDILLIRQSDDFVEAFNDFETGKFIVENAYGELIYVAVEDSDVVNRNYCSSMTEYDIITEDRSQQEVLHAYRPYSCNNFCFPCCLNKLNVSYPPDILLGSVEQKWSFVQPKFDIKNSYGDTVLRINGPYPFGLTLKPFGFTNVDFIIMSADGVKELGRISNRLIGRTAFTESDSFGIQFPSDLNISKFIQKSHHGSTFHVFWNDVDF